MRRFDQLWPLGALSCTLGGVGVGCESAASQATGPAACEKSFDEAGVRAAFDRQRAAWNEGDLDGFLAGYERSEDFVFTSGAKIRRGYDELAAGFADRYGDDTSSMGALTFELVDIRPLGTCDDAAVVLGRWILTDGQANGSGVFSVVLEHEETGWRIVHDHTSSAAEGRDRSSAVDAG